MASSNYTLNSHHHRWLWYLIILPLVPLTQFAMDIYVPALPALTNYFHTLPAIVNFTVSVYLLVLAISQLIIGPMSDAYGRRPVLLLGLFIFTIGSVIASYTNSIYLLIAARVIQAFGATAPSVLFKAIIADVFHGTEMLSIMATAATIWGLGPIVAPVIGGYIQHYVGWRYCFALLALYGLTMFSIVFLKLPETHHPHNQTPLHFNKLLTNIKRIFSNKSFIQYVLSMSLAYSILMAFNVMAPFIIQVYYGKDVLFFSHSALLFGMSYFFGAVVMRLLSKRLTEKLILQIAFIIMAITSVLMILLLITSKHTIIATIIPSMLMAFSVALIYPIYLSRCMRLFPDVGGLISSVTGFAGIGVSSLLIMLVGSIHVHNDWPLAIVFAIFASLIILLNIVIPLMKKPR